MQKQGSIVHPLRDLANCSKLRMANLGWAEFKPHLRGSLGHGPNQHKRAVPRRGHGAKSLTQHRHAGPSANSGSVDTVPEPSGCTPLSLSSCDHRQAALSAAGCECSLPDMNACKKLWCPNPPNRGTKPQEGRRHGVCRVERASDAEVRQLRASPEGFGELQQVAHGECGMG